MLFLCIDLNSLIAFLTAFLLVVKFIAYGFDEKELNYIYSDLNGGKQYVKTKNTMTDFINIMSCVLRGTIGTFP